MVPKNTRGNVAGSGAAIELMLAAQLVMVLVSSVTAPLRAKALPSVIVAPVYIPPPSDHRLLPSGLYEPAIHRVRCYKSKDHANLHHEPVIRTGYTQVRRWKKDERC